MAEIVFLRRGEEVIRYHLDDPITRIGRGSHNDIVLPEHSADVEPHHIQIERNQKSFLLRDLSGKGVEINGSPVATTFLRDQDRMRLGVWEICFREGRGEGRQAVSQRDTTLPMSTEGELSAPAEALLRYTFQGRSHEIPLGKTAVNLGKYEDNHVCIPEPYISGFHCRIYHKNGRYFLRDLDSKNGTWINGLRIVEGEIPDGAEIRLGMMPLVFQLQPPAGSQEAPEWPGFYGIVTQDPQMIKLFDILKRLTDTDAPVLIQGESGTGKELFARALHEESERKSNPFVATNCGAISAELIESTLFGHEKGAFTGAVQTRIGLFEEAGRGTLFLDEIGDLPLAQQVAFLRVLQLGTFRRVGGQKELQSHSRIVTATHRDLHHLVADGLFREDLLYRISVLHLAIPPLRERKGDILLLARYFLHTFAGQRGLRFSSAALDALQAYPWPGNVRELRNVIQRAIVFVQGTEITSDLIQFRPSHRPSSLPTPPLSSPTSFYPSAPAPSYTSPSYTSLPSVLSSPTASGMGTPPSTLEISSQSLDDAEKKAIMQALETSGGIVSEATKLLGIGRSTLYSKMKKHGIDPQAFKGS